MSKINYDLGKIRGFVFDVDGVLSPSTVPMGQDGVPCRMANVKDGYVMQLAVKHGYKFAIISGGESSAFLRRCVILGITDVYMSVSEKLPFLKDWLAKEGLHPDEIVYIGDDVPDIECMKCVGLPVSPADGCTDVKNVARYISPIKGGHGVVRDVVEEVMRAQGTWMSDDHDYKW